MEVDIYIKNRDGVYEIIDLFKDESIVIKLKLKDTSDLSKIFSTFSQSFVIPSSIKNNRILNYYFDTSVLRNSNRYIDTKIYINKELFKSGKISINEGKFQRNNSLSYTINFFTSLTSLRDLFGDSLLGDSLSLIDPWTTEWSDGRAYLYSQDKVNAPTFDPDIFVPLVSNKRVWSYNDATSNDIKHTGTLSGVKAIEGGELRPAIPFSKIMDGLAQAYDLEFTSPLFDLDAYKKMYVWCNGSNKFTNTFFVKHTSNWVNIDADWTVSSTIGSEITNIKYNGVSDPLMKFYFNFQPKIMGVNVESGTTIKYRWVNADTNQTMSEGNFLYITQFYSLLRFKPSDHPLIKTSGLNIKLEITLFDGRETWVGIAQNLFRLATPTDTLSASCLNKQETETFNLFKSLPVIKTVDFLSSFIKMFNISIIEDRDNNNVINFIPREDFYGETIDLTKYIDITDHRALPSNLYKNINFKHKTSKYKSNEDFKRAIITREFGELKYTSPDENLKETYEVQTAFSIVPTRHIPNTFVNTFYGFESGVEEDAIYGQLFNPNESEFTIFYYNGSTQIKDAADANASFNFRIIEGGGTVIYALNTYNKVSISTSLVNSLAFSVEIDVNDNTSWTNNLYSNYYRDEIEAIYNNNARIFEYSCYLPPEVINSLDLRSILIIEDKKFSMVEVDVELTTGKTKLLLMSRPIKNSDIIYAPMRFSVKLKES